MSKRVLSLYIARRFTATLAIILAAAALIALLADYMEVLRKFSDEADFTALTGLKLSAMRVLIVLDAVLPFAFLFGAVISLIDLTRRSEIVAARASGVSVWGFLAGPAMVALVFGALAATIFNPLAVGAKRHATALESELTGKAPRSDGYWFRQIGGGESSIVHAGTVNDNGEVLIGITAFVFGEDGRFREKVLARDAAFYGDRWVLRDAEILSATGPLRKAESYELATQIQPDEVQRSFAEPRAVSIWALPGFIATAFRTGLDPNPFRVAFHTLLSRPLMLLAMVLIAATVSLRPTRYGGTWRLVLTGAATGFLLYAASEIVSDLGANGIVNPVLAAWLSPLVALTFGATALLYQEDG